MKLLMQAIWVVLCLATGFVLVQTFMVQENNQQLAKCEHKLLSHQCAFCDPSLIESLGFCHGHGVPEAFCTRCSPHLIPAFQFLKDWCEEHSLPESQCKKCQEKSNLPKGYLKVQKTPTTGGKATTADSKRSDELKFSLQKSEGLNSARKANKDCDNSGTVVTLKNLDIARALKLEFTRVQTSLEGPGSRCNVQIGFNENKFAHITPRVSGTVHKVYVEPGDMVEAGQILASIHAPEFAQAKSEYLQARALYQLWAKNHTMESDLQKSGATTKRSLLEAQTAMVENRVRMERASQELRILGLAQSVIENLNKEDAISSLFEIKAPFAGTVIERHAVLGETVEKSHVLFQIANLENLWANLSLYPQQVSKVLSGDSVKILFPELSERIYEGKISWIASRIDPHTRTLEARVILSNQEKLLKAGMIGEAIIKHRESSATGMVPKEAVQWDGCCNVVFLKLNETQFKTHKVEIQNNSQNADFFELKTALPENSQIVTKGAYLLKTELMKGSIGAGCCEVEPGE